MTLLHPAVNLETNGAIVKNSVSKNYFLKNKNIQILIYLNLKI